MLTEGDNEGTAGIYCDAVEGTPAMAFSGEQGVLLYYEVLQVGWQIHLEGLHPNNPTFCFEGSDSVSKPCILFLKLLFNETIEDPNWSDVELGVDKWSIHNKESGDWDGAYLAPYMYQVKHVLCSTRFNCIESYL